MLILALETKNESHEVLTFIRGLEGLPSNIRTKQYELAVEYLQKRVTPAAFWGPIEGNALWDSDEFDESVKKIIASPELIAEAIAQLRTRKT